MLRRPDDIRDELLVLRCLRRDLEAWDELVRRYNDRLFYYVRRMVDQDEQAAHLLQEVWVRVLQSLRSLRQGSRLAPWLYSLTRHVVMSHYRERYSTLEVADHAELEERPTDESADAARFEDAELIHFGLSRIGWAEREVLTLHFLDDLSVAEIATVLGIPPGTVKSRLHRAKSELRQVLIREHGESIGKETHHA
ncbi:MAG: sigma-70 family RNA polymerase sigma factor [Candidatus Saccharimonas sp.]|nr:sigma-70 family RNA polymerase sigma factor [Planctomycetaceae bacterium]